MPKKKHEICPRAELNEWLAIMPRQSEVDDQTDGILDSTAKRLGLLIKKEQKNAR